MKRPIRLQVIRSTLVPGHLSVRLLGEDPNGSGSSFKKALMLEGYVPGDVVELRLVAAEEGPQAA